jgi:transcriptional regulator with XRE-family HTH domain
MPLSPAQCRAARALLGWSEEQLSAASGVAPTAIADFEAGRPSPHDPALADLRAAFAAAGVDIFGEDGAGGPGVRWYSVRPADEGRRPEDLNATNDD